MTSIFFYHFCFDITAMSTKNAKSLVPFLSPFWPREILGRIAAVMPHRAAAVYPRQTRPTLILRSVNAALLEGTLPSYHKARRDSSAILRCEVTSTSGVGGGGRAPVPELTPASPKIFFKAEPPSQKPTYAPAPQIMNFFTCIIENHLHENIQ